MQPHSSKDISNASEAVQPTLSWNALPVEILSIIFDYVSASFPAQDYDPDAVNADYTESEIALKKAFLTLALVCRRWHAATQPYLLRVLCIRFTGRSPKGLLDVLQWLDTQLFLCVSGRRLRLIMADAPVESSDESAEKSGVVVSSGCDPSLVHTLLLCFHNVRAVELVHLVFDRTQLIAYASTITAGHTSGAAPIDLDTLVLAYGRYEPLSADTVQLCTAWFGTVSNFAVLWDPYAGLDHRAMLESLPARLAICTLMIDTPVHKGVGERLCRSPMFGEQCTLRTLHARFAPSIFDSLDSLVRPAARVLEELDLDFTPWLTVPRIQRGRFPATARFPFLYRILSEAPIVDLSALPRLRELTVRLSLMYEAWDIVHRIIDTLIPRPQTDGDGRGLPPLRYVTLAPQAPASELYDPAHEAQFARVSAVLADVPTLERCTLDLRAVRNAPDRLEHYKAWFNEHMAELHRKGILHFVV
ncbi:hypothetical protein BDW22DRAFT_1227709 [Trametopsis cervina]|nr:hypothetical protein BDW22DRAFT_1227709 [Trametopsis cervina]